MADAMVVARMTQEKKDAVARRFAEMGTNASSAINQLYDYVERTGRLPFDEAPRSDNRREKADRAQLWLSGLSRLPEGNVFQDMDDEDIRAMRLRLRCDTWEATQC